MCTVKRPIKSCGSEADSVRIVEEPKIPGEHAYSRRFSTLAWMAHFPLFGRKIRMALASRGFGTRPPATVEELLELKGVDHVGVLCQLALLNTIPKESNDTYR